jgi:hypothetical protein
VKEEPAELEYRFNVWVVHTVEPAAESVGVGLTVIDFEALAVQLLTPVTVTL